MKRVLLCGSPWFIAILMLAVCPIFASQPLPAADVDVTDAFLSHVKSLDVASDLKKEVQHLVQELRSDEYTRMEAVTSGLALIL